jgi:predicted HAD superfamily phosphohydrolase YqeG
MTHKLARALVALLFVALVAPMGLAAAQSATTTVTITETDLNSRLRVTSPLRQQISGVFVDVQEGQIVITGTLTIRRGVNAGAYAFAVTVVPSIVNNGTRNRVEWTVTNFTVNGTEGTGQFTVARDRLQSALDSALSNRTLNAQSVTVSGDTVTIVYTR